MMQGSLAMRLRVLRAERGLSLTEAAERAGIQRQTLALLERGERHPHNPTLAKIAKGYGVPVEELLRREEGIVGLEDSDAGLEATTSPKDEAPSTPETTGEERRQQSYPYPWMAETLAETLGRWSEESLRRDDPKYS